jgi:hypothetical protein
MVLLRIVLVVLIGVAQEAFLLLQMGHNAEPLRSIQPTSRRSLESGLATDEQVAGGGIATALLAWMKSGIRSMQWCAR